MRWAEGNTWWRIQMSLCFIGLQRLWGLCERQPEKLGPPPDVCWWDPPRCQDAFSSAVLKWARLVQTENWLPVSCRHAQSEKFVKKGERDVTKLGRLLPFHHSSLDKTACNDGSNKLTTWNEIMMSHSVCQSVSCCWQKTYGACIKGDDSGYDVIYKQTRTMRWEAGLNAGHGSLRSLTTLTKWHQWIRKRVPVPDQNGAVEGGTKL